MRKKKNTYQRHVRVLRILLLRHITEFGVATRRSQRNAGPHLDHRHIVDLRQIVLHIVLGHLHGAGELHDVGGLLERRSHQFQPEVGQKDAQLRSAALVQRIPASGHVDTGGVDVATGGGGTFILCYRLLKWMFLTKTMEIDENARRNVHCLL